MLGGVLQQLVNPLIVWYLRDGESVNAEPVDQGAEERAPRAGQVIGVSGRLGMGRNMPYGCRADIGGHEVERQVDIGRQARIRDEPYQRAHLGSSVPDAGAMIS